MGQIIDNLNNIKNIMPEEVAGISNKHSQHNNLSVNDNKDMDSLLGYKFTKEKKDNYLENTTMKNFEEYLKNKQEKLRQAGQDAASEEEEKKENEKEVARSLSADEIKRLKLMGVDVEGASMSDLMGMVNTMRYNAHKEENLAMMAEIALSDGDADGLSVIGGAVSVNGVRIDADVMDVSIAESKEERLQNSEFDKDVKNAGEANPDVTGEKTENPEDKNIIGNNEIVYLLHNDMPVNEDNLYKAHFSGTRISDKGISDEMFEEMKPQIEKVIEQAGLDIDEETLKDVKLLIDNDIPVTTDNVRRYENLKEFIGKDASEIINNISENESLEAAEKFLNDVKAVSPDLVYDMAKKGKEVTIASAVREISSYDNEAANATADKNAIPEDEAAVKRLSEYEKDMEAGTLDAKAVSYRRQMEEIRLSMTLEVSVRMTSLDINIDTREMSRVINALRDVEKKLLGDTFKKAGVELNNENIVAYNEFVGKVSDIAGAPMEILASPMRDRMFSVNSLHASISTVEVGVQKFETVVRSYEVVGTAPRADMGDSIRKAFGNITDILEDMDVPVNYETERAIKILGYNSIEITKSNITEVMNYDRQVNELINNLYPEAVLGMIKDNINPLDASIEELNKTIRNRRYNEGVSEAEDFASYLRDMEAKGEVSAEERESYIGIYRMMNKLAKSGDREAGWLFANSSRLTVRNLLSAMRSRKNTGVDVSVDDEFGMLSGINEKGSRIDRQIESAFKSEMDIVPDNKEDILKDIERFNALDEAVMQFIKENDIELSMVNAFASDRMINTPGGIYGLVSEILSSMKFDADNTEELVDEETENMTDSLLGEDIGIDMAQFEMDSILESLRGSEEMSLKYEDLRNQITEMMYRMGAQGRLGSIDIASVKTINAGFNIMSNMAKREHFQIPVRTGEGINVINLSIEHNSENKGRISINMAKTTYGNLSADVKVMADGSLSGYVVSDTSEGNMALLGMAEGFAGRISGEGFEASDIRLGSLAVTNSKAEDEETNTDEKILYKAAVSLVKALADLNG